jgi:hypothetical protein
VLVFVVEAQERIDVRPKERDDLQTAAVAEPVSRVEILGGAQQAN